MRDNITHDREQQYSSHAAPADVPGRARRRRRVSRPLLDPAAAAAAGADVRRLDVRGRPDHHRADGGGRASSRRSSAGSPTASACGAVIVAVGVDADGRDGARGDLAEPAPADLLALRPGARDAGHLREHHRLHPRGVAAVARRPRDRRLHERHDSRRLHRPRGGRPGGRRRQLAGGVRRARDPDRRRRGGADGLAAAGAAQARRSTARRPAADSIGAPVRNRRLVATCGVGFCVLFTQVAMFTYVTFHLAAPPYSLSTVALGWLFVVYLVGAVVTPFAGRWIDRYGHRAGIASAMAIGGAGALLTLVPWLPAIVAGLALCATGVFIAQATTSSYIGAVTTQRSRARGRPVFDVLLRRRQRRRRAAGGLLAHRRLDRVRRARRRGASWSALRSRSRSGRRHRRTMTSCLTGIDRQSS